MTGSWSDHTTVCLWTGTSLRLLADVCASSVPSTAFGPKEATKSWKCWGEWMDRWTAGWMDRRIHSGRGRHLEHSEIIPFSPDTLEKGLYNWQTFF